MPKVLLPELAEQTFLVDVEELICYPWFVVTRATYVTGTAYTMVCCDVTETDDYDVFFNSILPPAGSLVGVTKTETLGAAEHWERTATFWTSQ